MFHKIHLKMTLFHTLVTSAILIVMSLAGLFVFESLLTKNESAVFDKNQNAILTYLDGQNIIDHEKLMRLADNRYYTIALFEKGMLLFQNQMGEPSGQKGLIDAAYQTAKNDYQFDIENPPVSRSMVKYLNFGISFQNKKYYASVASLPNSAGILCAVILFDRSQMFTQIFQLRLTFLCIDITAILLLFLFARKFTGQMLSPIEENRKQQVQFVAAASHELRSPLSVMLASVTALKAADEEDMPGFYEAIESEGSRMKRLIDDMLTLANADNQSWSVRFEETQLDTLLLDVYEKYSPLTRNRGMSLHISLPEEPLPQCCCDRQRIEQVLTILLNNAMSYSPEGNSITLGIRLTDGKLKLWVADQGYGIPDELKQKIFLRFFRADQARKDREHFGLGLCIASEIIRLHQGKIWVEDNPGGGSVFYFTLAPA